MIKAVTLFPDDYQETLSFPVRPSKGERVVAGRTYCIEKIAWRTGRGDDSASLYLHLSLDQKAETEPPIEDVMGLSREARENLYTVYVTSGNLIPPDSLPKMPIGKLAVDVYRYGSDFEESEYLDSDTFEKIEYYLDRAGYPTSAGS